MHIPYISRNCRIYDLINFTCRTYKLVRRVFIANYVVQLQHMHSMKIEYDEL